MAPAYPYPGCIVEYLEDNEVQIGMVTEDSGGKLRLLLPNRKEVKLAASRILPWPGPVYPAGKTKEEILKILESHKTSREKKTSEVSVIDAWELSQGEIDKAKASWIAELIETNPDEDTIAAYGRALLMCKTHFRFMPPDFLIFDETTVSHKKEEEEARIAREKLAVAGNSFIRALWDAAVHKRAMPDSDDKVFPPQDLQDRIKRLLKNRMAAPESQEDESLWQIISKGLPDEPHIPLRLLMAWGVVPPHYNFWLDRADYIPGDSWWQNDKEKVAEITNTGKNPPCLQQNALPFVSIDGPTTFDIDDAFYLKKTNDGFEVTLAFANPAFAWPFGTELDKKVMHRATSIYLPEGDLHMLPEPLGIDACSLKEKEKRLALCINLKLDQNGNCIACEPAINIVEVSANLRYEDVQKTIDGNISQTCAPYANLLMTAHELALIREKLRVSNGAVVMVREDPHLILHETQNDIKVELVPEPKTRDAQRLVSELMILASAAIADWAFERQIPLLYRTQNVALPKEYSGVWEKPEQLTQIIRSMVPSILEITPKPHSALGLSRYAQITSPLRRYPDLVNEAQLIHFLQTGSYRWDETALENMLHILTISLDAAGQAQRFRPRYWKLLYFQQQGDKIWYNGIVTDENENMVTVTLPTENIAVRGRRHLFDERTAPGMNVKIRVGKINPLLNDIHILEALSEE